MFLKGNFLYMNFHLNYYESNNSLCRSLTCWDDRDYWFLVEFFFSPLSILMWLLLSWSISYAWTSNLLNVKFYRRTSLFCLEKWCSNGFYGINSLVTILWDFLSDCLKFLGPLWKELCSYLWVNWKSAQIFMENWANGSEMWNFGWNTFQTTSKKGLRHIFNKNPLIKAITPLKHNQNPNEKNCWILTKKAPEKKYFPN